MSSCPLSFCVLLMSTPPLKTLATSPSILFLTHSPFIATHIPHLEVIPSSKYPVLVLLPPPTSWHRNTFTTTTRRLTTSHNWDPQLTHLGLQSSHDVFRCFPLNHSAEFQTGVSGCSLNASTQSSPEHLPPTSFTVPTPSSQSMELPFL